MSATTGFEPIPASTLFSDHPFVSSPTQSPPDDRHHSTTHHTDAQSTKPQKDSRPDPISPPATSGQDTPINISPSASYHSGSSRSIGPFCRICHDDDRVETLISPCWCTGSMGLVHKSCLERWLTVSNCEKCELCNFAFSVVRKPKPFWKFLVQCENRDIWRAILVDVLCLFLLTPLAVLSIYLCVVGALQYAHPDLEDSTSSGGRAKDDPRGKILLVKAPRIEGGDGLDGHSIVIHHRPEMTMQQDNFEKELIEWEAMGLIILAVLLFAIFSAWATAVVGYHVRTWRRWRLTHQDLVLLEPARRGSRAMSVSSLCHSVQVTPVSLVSVGVSRTQGRLLTGSTDSLLSAADEPDSDLNHGERASEEGRGQYEAEATACSNGSHHSTVSLLRDTLASKNSMEELNAATLCKILGEQRSSSYLKIVDDPDEPIEDLASPPPLSSKKSASVEHKL